MYYDRVEWDEFNEDHALKRATQQEIEQVIENAATARPHNEFANRVVFIDHTNGGKRLLVIAAYYEIRDVIRPITAWEV